MKNNLTFLQKLAADLGRPNNNGGSNYSDPEMRYYLRDVLRGYNEFIPTPVLRDAWKGADTWYAQPMSGGTNYPDSDMFRDMIRQAIDTRLENRNAERGVVSPTGADYHKMWNAPLSPSDEIIRQLRLGEQLGSSTEDYYPPMEY